MFSAICVIFAHGAGEVGYMAGPLATIWDVYSTGKLSKSVTPQVSKALYLIIDHNIVSLLSFNMHSDGLIFMCT